MPSNASSQVILFRTAAIGFRDRVLARGVVFDDLLKVKGQGRID
jgi:hypothetical protein